MSVKSLNVSSLEQYIANERPGQRAMSASFLGDHLQVEVISENQETVPVDIVFRPHGASQGDNRTITISCLRGSEERVKELATRALLLPVSMLTEQDAQAQARIFELVPADVHFEDGFAILHTDDFPTAAAAAAPPPKKKNAFRKTVDKIRRAFTDFTTKLKRVASTSSLGSGTARSRPSSPVTPPAELADSGVSVASMRLHQDLTNAIGSFKRCGNAMRQAEDRLSDTARLTALSEQLIPTDLIDLHALHTQTHIEYTAVVTEKSRDLKFLNTTLETQRRHKNEIARLLGELQRLSEADISEDDRLLHIQAEAVLHLPIPEADFTMPDNVAMAIRATAERISTLQDLTNEKLEQSLAAIERIPVDKAYKTVFEWKDGILTARLSKLTIPTPPVYIQTRMRGAGIVCTPDSQERITTLISPDFLGLEENLFRGTSVATRLAGAIRDRSVKTPGKK